MNLKLRDPDGSRHLEIRDNSFILGLIVDGAKPECVRLLDYELLWGNDDYRNSNTPAI